MTNGSEVDTKLYEALGTSQRLGFLGDRPIDAVIEHARVFARALDGVSGSVIDLGSGGGVPGLVLAVERADLRITLIDRRTKRTDFLSRMVRRLGLTDRVIVVAAEVDDAIRSGHVGYDAAIARGFGPPDFTLRTAVRCTRPGGEIVISEPPASVDASDRWPPELLSSVEVTRSPSDERVAHFVRIS